MKETVYNLPWWKGSRGEWLVVIQVLLMALVFFGPPNLLGWPLLTFPFDLAGRIAGSILLLAGSLLLLAGIVRLGTNLTPLPYPKDDANLVETGPYRIVRHPMYAGGIILAFGYALLVNGVLTMVYVFILFAFFDYKSRREEAWLEEKFSKYGGYQKRVRKLIPFVY